MHDAATLDRARHFIQMEIGCGFNGNEVGTFLQVIGKIVDILNVKHFFNYVNLSLTRMLIFLIVIIVIM